MQVLFAHRASNHDSICALDLRPTPLTRVSNYVSFKVIALAKESVSVLILGCKREKNISKTVLSANACFLRRTAKPLQVLPLTNAWSSLSAIVIIATLFIDTKLEHPLCTATLQGEIQQLSSKLATLMAEKNALDEQIMEANVGIVS